MKLVQPIRSTETIEKMKQELLKTGYRNYMLFVFGINVGLRISDIIKLKVQDVEGKQYLKLTEQKTGKAKKILITNISDELEKYIDGMAPDEYLFRSRNGENKPITRVQAYRILNKAARAAGIDGEIGTHTLRKTFGYHLYQKTHDVALLQEMFNHSAPSVTMRYIGLRQDNLDAAMSDFRL